MKRLSAVWAALLLVTLVRINAEIWPVPWPDEALFSSPAAEMAQGRPFTTPVLSGLIYGMDRATLWNCPLHMVLLSFVYRLSGESLEAGRLFSLFLGTLALAVFYLIARRFAAPLIAGSAACILALSPVFQRAANTIRMDMLTLLLMLSCLLFLLQAREDGRRARISAYLAGLCAGLALISHPFAVILAPVLLLFTFASWKQMWRTAAGAAAGFLPWAVYIAQNPGMFEAQFLAQLKRKWLLAQNVTKGETGGLHQVFFSQYGFYDGTKAAMVIAALLYAAAGLVALIYVIRRLREGALRSAAEPGRSRDLLLAASGLAAGFAYVSTEGWYVLYGDTFLVLTAVIFFADRGAEGRALQAQRLLLPACALIFAGLTAYFTLHNLQTENRRQSREFLADAVETVSACKSVYVRVRPDPYFAVKHAAPAIRYYEFIPGKLEPLPEHEPLLYSTWDRTECFLLDQYETWEPRLTEYLALHRDRFDVTNAGTYAPLRVQAQLYRRRNVH